MFITRKEYDLGGDNKAPGYELFDDYNVRAQLTPTQAKELYLWLAGRVDQIDKDITGETSIETLEEIAARWKTEVEEETPDLTLEHRDRQNELDIDDPNYVFPEDR